MMIAFYVFMVSAAYIFLKRFYLEEIIAALFSFLYSVKSLPPC